MFKTALVTGGAGFIGSHLVDKLIDLGITVRVIDNLSTGNKDNLNLNKIEFIEDTLLNSDAVAQAVQDIEIIFHLAAMPSVPKSVKDPMKSHLNGAHTTMILLNQAIKTNVQRIVYSASSSAYGDTPTLPKLETMTPHPKSPYAATKLAAEYYMKSFAECYNIDTCSLRYFNIFGPRQDPNSPYSGVLAKFCMAYNNNTPITINGDGEQSRDFTYVDNAVQANILAMKHSNKLNGMVFNIGCGKRITLNNIVLMLNKLTHRNVQLIHAAKRQGDVKHSLADINKAKKILKYKPLIYFREGLEQTFKWYASQ
jgi:nucleoside-diphosphate-sugar epimerase